MRLYLGVRRQLVAVVCLGVSFLSASVYAFPVEVAEAPATDLALILHAIHSANHSLRINIYELTSLDIVDAIIERIQKGVHVEILEEGQPVGGFSNKEKT